MAEQKLTSQNIPFQNQQPIFQRMGNISELSHLNEHDRLLYETSLDIYRTNKAVMANERYEGVQEGILQERVANIHSMRRNGLDDETIANILTIDFDFVRQH